MILVDVNLLVAATMTSAADHQAARSWLQDRLSGTARVGLPWVCLTGFARVASQARAWERPMPVADAVSVVRSRDFARWSDLGLRSRDPLCSQTACVVAGGGRPADLNVPLWPAGRRELLLDVAEHLEVVKHLDDPSRWPDANAALPG